MHGVEEGPSIGEPTGVTLTGLQAWWYRVSIWWWRNVTRRLPCLVWRGQEVDVQVTLMNDPLPDMTFADGEQSDAMRPLFSGAYAEMERTFGEMGITFDRGMGCGGRDWEWDWSLSGPIRIKFRGRAKRPDRRRAPLRAVK